MSSTLVCLERGKRRVFASALDWPGWCRSGGDEEGALAALDGAAPRYREVAEAAGVRFPAVEAVEVVERLPGNASTDFGAPGAIAAYELTPATAAEAVRLASLVTAGWAVFDRVVAGAPPTLRKGPRGGGRDRDQIVAHVLEAEESYSRKLGLRLERGAADRQAAVCGQRARIVGLLSLASDGRPPVERGWPPRYAARRIAWHVLDHAWEIGDRSEPEAS